jgi:hypothetical protein
VIDRTTQAVVSALHVLPRRVPPSDLTTRLRVIASRERTRRGIFATMQSAAAHYRERAMLVFENLARPLAIPAVGGVAAALIILGIAAMQYPIPAHARSYDVPTVLYTEASFKNMGLFPLDTEEVVIDLTIDESGRVLDYQFVDGGVPIQNDQQLKRQIDAALLFAEFVPATSFGQPIPGKVRLSFRRGHIDVRG